MDNKSQVKIGTTAAQRKLFFNLRKEADRLLAEYDKVDTKLLAESLDVKEKDVIEMQMRLSAPDFSIDAPLRNDDDSEGGTLRGALLASQNESVEEILASSEIQRVFGEHLDEFRQTLKGRDLEIFEDRMMSEQPLTLQELGDKYGVSRERARQLESKIIKNLKKFVKQKGIIDVEPD
jgi:RNA polymerase sigma-32 factor